MGDNHRARRISENPNGIFVIQQACQIWVDGGPCCALSSDRYQLRRANRLIGDKFSVSFCGGENFSLRTTNQRQGRSTFYFFFFSFCCFFEAEGIVAESLDRGSNTGSIGLSGSVFASIATGERSCLRRST